jgi:hypothetical protein
MELNFHKTKKGIMLAEAIHEKGFVIGTEEIMDIMAEARMNDCDGLIIHKDSLQPEFFDLKTRIAGEILQKFSNYRMRLCIVGDFTAVKSKSLRDFIGESNRYGTIRFTSSLDEALSS